MRLEHWFYTIPLRIRSLFRRRQIEQELDEELQIHLVQQIQHEMSHGATAGEARYAALRAMGGLEQRKEECRDLRRMNIVDDLRRNFQYSARALKRSPGFAVVAIITLALGIGANTAIFSLVDAVMLKMLPVKSPEQLYLVGHKREGMSMSWDYPDYRAMRDHNTSFAGLAGYSLGLEPVGVQSGYTAGSATDLSHGIYVSGNYFDVLGVVPVLGRVFNAADDRAPGVSPYVVLSYAYWRSHFNGDTQVVGRKLSLDGYPFTVIGVAPAGFIGADIALKPDLFIPIMMRSEVKHVAFASWNDRHAWWMAAIGRLKPDTGLKKAEDQLFAIYRGQALAEDQGLFNLKSANMEDRIVLTPAARGFSYMADQLKKPLLILFVIVALVLLIACANVANLMLARAATRQREIAVRLAVGASRWRVISQLLTESMLLALLGGLSGIVVALIGIRVLLRFTPHPGYQLSSIDATLDWRALAFAFTACLLTGLLFGIVPAWQSTRPDLVPALKTETSGLSGGSRFTLRRGLVILQVALSLPLLWGASLFVRTLGNLRELDTGFSPENVFIASVDPSAFGYKSQQTLDFYNRLNARVSGLPGVRATSLALLTPLTGSSWDGTASVEGYTGKHGERNGILLNAVGPRYFETLGTSITLGRDFTGFDNPAMAIELPDHPTPQMKLRDPPGHHVAIVNEIFARRFFADRRAIGKHVALEGPFRTAEPYEVVGVVKDARYSTMREAAEPMIFLPVWRRFAAQTELLIRTAGPTPQLAAELRGEIQKLDPVIPLLNLRTVKQDVDESILVERLVATLSGFFGALALLLSALGLYGVVAYTVTQRTREIGIRMAIGAERKSVLWLVIKDVVVMVLIGTVIGVCVAFMTNRAIAGILFGVSATDPASAMAAGCCLAAAAIVASFLPARRAAQIEPTAALRSE